ncbi:hypothetical protein TNCV_712101 [Trichonephila clavipes]|nr:hypothetical protein TNCV_712101 [Trichonephila clavipes]
MILVALREKDMELVNKGVGKLLREKSQFVSETKTIKQLKKDASYDDASLEVTTIYLWSSFLTHPLTSLTTEVRATGAIEEHLNTEARDSQSGSQPAHSPQSLS